MISPIRSGSGAQRSMVNQSHMNQMMHGVVGGNTPYGGVSGDMHNKSRTSNNTKKGAPNDLW